MNNLSPNPNSLLMFENHNPRTNNKNVKKTLFSPDKKSFGGDNFDDDSVLGDPLTEAIKNIELRHSLEQHNSLGYNFYSGRKERSARKNYNPGTPEHKKREHK